MTRHLRTLDRFLQGAVLVTLCAFAATASAAESAKPAKQVAAKAA